MHSDTTIVPHTRLTTITCMRTFCSVLPVGSRSRLRSYIALGMNYAKRMRSLPGGPPFYYDSYKAVETKFTVYRHKVFDFACGRSVIIQISTQ